MAIIKKMLERGKTTNTTNKQLSNTEPKHELHPVMYTVDQYSVDRRVQSHPQTETETARLDCCISTLQTC